MYIFPPIVSNFHYRILPQQKDAENFAQEASSFLLHTICKNYLVQSIILLRLKNAYVSRLNSFFVILNRKKLCKYGIDST